jgi:hypothetical protein
METEKDANVNYKGYLLLGSARPGQIGDWQGMVAIHRYADVQREVAALPDETYERAVASAILYGKQMVDGERSGLKI